MVNTILFCLLSFSAGAVIVFIRAYYRMLLDCRTPWFLEAPAGEIILWVMFQTSRLLRIFHPQTLNAALAKAAFEKVRVLEKSPPAPGGICFIGSSTITFWHFLEHDFSQLGLPVFNAGFGGSCVEDILPFTERLCTNFKPRIVVYFCGTNNIMQGLSIDSAVAGFQTFVKKVHKIDPAIKIVYLGITTTPFCYSSNISNAVVKIKEVNRLVQEYCESIPDKITFVSTEDLKKNWVKNSDFYLGDRHHINDEGHRMMGKLLLPVLENAIRIIK